MENQELQGEREITEMLRPPPAAASKLQSRETDSEISTQYSGCGGLSVPTAFSPVPRIRSCNGLVHRVRKSGFDHQARKHCCGTQLAWALRRLSGVSALTSMFISSGALHRRGSSPAAGSGLLHAPRAVSLVGGGGKRTACPRRNRGRERMWWPQLKTGPVPAWGLRRPANGK
jgi:hypothetical protein